MLCISRHCHTIDQSGKACLAAAKQRGFLLEFRKCTFTVAKVVLDVGLNLPLQIAPWGKGGV